MLALACPTLYLFFVGGESQRKLFHAIVGLGLAAAGCGGKEQTPSADAGQTSPPQGGSEHDANAEAATENEPEPDAATSIDASAAADVAADVAQEIWHPIVIQ